MNNFKSWPDNWPEYHNGGQLCDMAVGPCACGATHQVGEFRLMGFILFRYGERVVTDNRRELAFKGETMKNVTMKNVTVLKRIQQSAPTRYVYVPIIKNESFADLKALEKCIMDEAFININNVVEVHNLSNKRGDVFLIIAPDWCKILLLVPTEYRPQWSEWDGDFFEI